MNLDLEKIRLIHEDIGRLEVTAAKVMTPIPKSVIFFYCFNKFFFFC